MLFRIFLTERTALAATLLIAISPFHIAMAQELNYPSLLFFFAVLSLIAMFRFVEKGSLCSLIGFLVFSLCAFLSHYNFLLFLFGMNFSLVVLFLIKKDWGKLVRWIEGQGILFVTGLLMAGSFPEQTGRRLEFIPVNQIWAHLKELPFGRFPRIYDALLMGVHLHYSTKNIVLTGILLLIVIISLILSWKALDRDKKILLFLITFLPAIVGFVMMLTVGLPFFPKYYFYLLPLLLILILRGWDVPKSAILRRMVYAILIVIFSISLYQYYIGLRADEDNATIIRYMNDYILKGDVVLVNPPYLSLLFDFYAPDSIYPNGVPENFNPKIPYTGIRRLTGSDLVRLGNNLKKFRRVWVFYGLGTHTQVDPEGMMEKWLKEHYYLVETRRFIMAPTYKTKDGVLYLFEIQK